MGELFSPAPDPATELGRYRILSSTAGVRVSPLQLGAMSIGDAWQEFMGSMDKKASFKLLDAFVEAGGNFIDTANNYRKSSGNLLVRASPLHAICGAYRSATQVTLKLPLLQ